MQLKLFFSPCEKHGLTSDSREEEEEAVCFTVPGSIADCKISSSQQKTFAKLELNRKNKQEIKGKICNLERDSRVNARSWPCHQGINSFHAVRCHGFPRAEKWQSWDTLGNGEHGSQGWAAAKSKGKIRIGCYVLQLLHKCAKLWGKKRNSAARTLAFFGKNMIFLAVKVSVHL